MTETVGSWLPIKLYGKDGGHLHGLIWWEWNRKWEAELLPKGVEIIGLGPGREECAVCQVWGRPGGVGAAAHPARFSPEAVGTGGVARISEETEPEDPVEAEESREEAETGGGLFGREEAPEVRAPVEAKPNDFTDF